MYQPDHIDPSATVRVLAQVSAERARQDQKWGQQHHPSYDPEMCNRFGSGAEAYGLPSAALAKARCGQRAVEGRVTWADILVEEVAEALEAVSDPRHLREELLQVAAVAAAWAEDLDRWAEEGRHG